MITIRSIVLPVLAGWVLALPCPGFAVGEVAQTITLDGQLFSDAAATSPLVDASIAFKLQVLDPTQTCIIYEETQSGLSTTSTDGRFNLQVGSAVGASKRTVGYTIAMSAALSNTSSVISGKLLSNGSVCTYTPTSGDARYLRVTFTPSDGVDRTVSPNVALDSVPSALVAERAENLRGLAPASFAQINVNAPAVLSQANLESIFSSTYFPVLTTLLSNGASGYVVSATNGTAVVPSQSIGTTAGLAAGEMWYDSGSLKYFNGTAIQTVGAAGSGITSLGIGSGLTPMGTITTAGTTIAVNTGTSAGQIVQVQSGGNLPALGGSALTSLNGTAVQSGTIGGTTSVVTSGKLQTTTDVTSNRTFLYNNSGLGPNFVGFQAPSTLTSYTLTWPQGVGSTGQVLATDASGNLSWATPSTIATSYAGILPVSNGGLGVSSAGQNLVFAGPAGSSGAPAFRSLASSDLPAGTVSGAGSAGYIPYYLTSAGLSNSPLFTNGSNVGIGTSSVGARLQLAAGTSTAGTSPLKLTAGTSLATPEPGAIEYDGTSLFYTDSGAVRHTLAAAGAGLTALTGDVSASGAGSVMATVAFVGGSSAPNIHAAELLANAATSANTNSALVRRDGAGGFSAGAVSQSSALFRDASTHAVTISAPATSTTYTITLPGSVASTSGQVLSSDTSGNLSWTTSSTMATSYSGVLPIINGGTNSSAALNNNRLIVSSSGSLTEASALTNGQIFIGSNGSLPVAAVIQGGTGITVSTGAGTITVAATGSAGAASGDLSGSYPNPTVVRIQGSSISAAAPVSGQVLRYSGAAWLPNNLSMADLRSTVTGTTQLSACSASQTLTFTSVADNLSCTNIAIQSSQMSGIVSTNNGGTGTSTGSVTGTGALTFAAGGANQNVTLTPSGSGSTLLGSSVGVGTSSPGTSLDVNGTMRLSKNGSAPYACDIAHDAALAVTANYTTCICRSTIGWVSTADGATTCTWPVSANLAIAVTTGSASAMNVAGVQKGTAATGSSVTFTVTNNGGVSSSILTFALSNTTNFALSGGTCVSGTTTLAVSGTCTIIVQPTANQNATYSGTLNVTANNNPSQALAGVASGFANGGVLQSPSTIASASVAYGITLSGDGNFAYVANYSANTVSMFSRNSTTGALASLSPATVTAAGAFFVALSPDGTSAYVSNSPSGGTAISLFSRNTTTGQLTPMATPTVSTGSQPYGIVVSPDNAFVYVVNFGSSTVSMFSRNTSTGALTALATPTIATGSGPYQMIMSGDGTSVYVANYTANTISIFSRNTVTGILSGSTTIPGGGGMYTLAMSPDGTSLYGSNYTGNTVSMFSRNTSTGALTALATPTVATGTAPYSIVISPDGLSAYVTNYSSGTISSYSRNTSTGALTATVTPSTGAAPTYSAISPDGNFVYISSASSGVIYIYPRQ